MTAGVMSKDMNGSRRTWDDPDASATHQPPATGIILRALLVAP